jgi:urea transport system ATP-binding protein
MGITVLLVEQKLGFARHVSEHFYIMERGQIKATGPISELSTRLIEGHLAV